MGRSPSPTLRVSVFPLEKIDAQILLARGGKVPEGNTASMKVTGNLRPTTGAHLSLKNK